MDFIRDSGGFCLPVMDCKDVYARALGHGKNNLNGLLTGRGKETGKGYFKGFRRISHASHGLKDVYARAHGNGKKKWHR
jgi:hypothetical protein